MADDTDGDLYGGKHREMLVITMKRTQVLAVARIFNTAQNLQDQPM